MGNWRMINVPEAAVTAAVARYRDLLSYSPDPTVLSDRILLRLVLEAALPHLPPALTGDEQEAVRLAGQLYSHIRDKVCGNGPTRDDDLAEVRAAVHHVQHLVMAQAAARLYPDELRLMGEVISSPGGARRPAKKTED